MDLELGIEEEELEIAGVNVGCLLRDMDDAELAVRELALYPQFCECFREAFSLIDSATSFWLEGGSYAECAELTSKTMLRLRDVIDEHASYTEAGSLPGVIRALLGVDHPALDSQLVATFALVLGVEAVKTLADWLFELELAVYDIDADLIELIKNDSPSQYITFIEKERDRRSGSEILAREQFAVLKGEAEQALLMANLYRQVENIDIVKYGLNTSNFMHRILGEAFAAKASKRGQEAGKGNLEPESKIQTETMERRSKIKAAAEMTINGRRIEKRSLSDAELTNILVKKKLGSEKTIRAHLTALGLRPLK